MIKIIKNNKEQDFDLIKLKSSILPIVGEDRLGDVLKSLHEVLHIHGLTNNNTINKSQFITKLTLVLFRLNPTWGKQYEQYLEAKHVNPIKCNAAEYEECESCT